MRQIFESENISYVELTTELLDDYLAMVNDMENVGRLIGRTETVSRDDEIIFIHKKLDKKAPLFSMIEKATGEFIGNIELMHGAEEEAELGIAITKNKQDRGFGTEAIHAIVEYARRELGLKRIFLKVFPDNARAIRVYEKCGFREYDRRDADVFMELSL